ncbi:TIGR03862 family flavoprotein [uncultured Oxalicibacterium sp.]|uniref:TIGR03862 family flavoprotein n=1 Tax=uncultured Oxalicibacterium sp. TaxID=1168540 RepID=UPI0025DE6F7F|nr:TIGR03862 family flavoprotein [uncultured Oxalicibacterium sp.]
MQAMTYTTEHCDVAIIGGGPAGLMAAETISASGHAVHLYDAMPSVGRKFLLAGKGGMNLTHAEPSAQFHARYGQRSATLTPMLHAFGADAVRDWTKGLGIDTFVGSSQRVFPTDMKAAPLLRAWLKRLRESGVQFHMRHRWMGWDEHQALRFATPDGERHVQANAVVLALGGGSWARLGSDGAWLPLLLDAGIASTPLKPANCGFDIAWSEHFRSRFAGQPLKSVIARCTDTREQLHTRQGECVISESGIEGGLIYALSAFLRDRIDLDGHATLTLDLAPGKSAERVLDEVSQPRGARSLSSHLQSKVGITGVKSGLLREVLSKEAFADPHQLAAAIKALPLTLVATRPIDEVISSAGGVLFESLDENLMAHAMPGVFCAGEMLDWEAPTGGYLLTACFASGRRAGDGVTAWLKHRSAR